MSPDGPSSTSFHVPAVLFFSSKVGPREVPTSEGTYVLGDCVTSTCTQLGTMMYAVTLVSVAAAVVAAGVANEHRAKTNSRLAARDTKRFWTGRPATMAGASKHSRIVIHGRGV
eukprot:2697834-Rhodomonas_salina.3